MAHPEATRRRAPRSDGLTNQARIVEAARTAFTESGSATLQSIAKAAGVGQGTIYRHFATREALLLAVYREDVEALVEAAPRLLRTHDDAVEALRKWLTQLAAYGRIKHGASLAVEAATRADLGNQYYPAVIGAIEQLLAAGKAAKQLRRDITADEILLLVSFLWKVDTGPQWRKTTDHLLSVILDGLRATTRNSNTSS